VDDFLILSQIKEGNSKAFKVFFDLYYGPLCNYLLNYTKNISLSEEIAQIAFVTFWDKRETIVVKSSIKTYLYRMAYTEFLKHVRNSSKFDQVLVDLTYKAIHNDFTQDEDLLEKKIQKLNRAINTLPKKSKEILTLKKEGFRNKEISQILNISIKTVEAHIRTSFKRIRSFFKESHTILLYLFKKSLISISTRSVKTQFREL